MDPLANIMGANLVREYANSALPNAPVVPDRPRRGTATPGPLRRVTANGLRGIADRLAPAPVQAPQAR